MGFLMCSLYFYGLYVVVIPSLQFVRHVMQESALWGAFDAFDCGAHDGKITLDETWPWIWPHGVKRC